MMWQDCNGQHAAENPCVFCTGTVEYVGFLARRGLRLTPRGEAVATLLMGFGLLAAGYLLLLLLASGGAS